MSVILNDTDMAMFDMPQPWRTTLGQNLRRVRLERDLSIRELAGHAKMYWIELERYEDAQQIPTLDRIYALAECLEVSIFELLPPHA